MVPRFSFLPPSTGDKLLTAASSVKLHLARWPDDESHAECRFEIAGDVRLSNDDAGELLQALVAEFRGPRSPRQEGGAV